MADLETAASSVSVTISAQIPYAFVHLIAIIVKVHLILASLYVGSYIGETHSVVAGKWSTVDVLWGFLVLAVTTFVYEGILELHAQLENPFGRGRLCIPRHSILQTTWAVCHQILNRSEEVLLPTAVLGIPTQRQTMIETTKQLLADSSERVPIVDKNEAVDGYLRVFVEHSIAETLKRRMILVSPQDDHLNRFKEKFAVNLAGISIRCNCLCYGDMRRVHFP
eukprot:GABV01008949.1.p1 GENE.GABV01008949.1~~GABV01008949.1.p1  ORF type:complete len:223 (-),score=37.92 GABV01008949.1:24-692(-)